MARLPYFILIGIPLIFPEKHVELIKNGKFRKIPVIRIFDQNRNTLIVVADTPESYWHTRSSEKGFVRSSKSIFSSNRLFNWRLVNASCYGKC